MEVCHKNKVLDGIAETGAFEEIDCGIVEKIVIEVDKRNWSRDIDQRRNLSRVRGDGVDGEEDF